MSLRLSYQLILLRNFQARLPTRHAPSSLIFGVFATSSEEVAGPRPNTRPLPLSPSTTPTELAVQSSDASTGEHMERRPGADFASPA